MRTDNTHMVFNRSQAFPRRRQWHPTPVLLPGKSHGWRSLVGCSPWSREESDTTEQLHFHFSLSCIGEGNGSPLQCSCLENPRDGGAWWAAVYGVAQSWTQLKWLSSSSSRHFPMGFTCIQSFHPHPTNKDELLLSLFYRSGLRCTKSHSQDLTELGNSPRSLVFTMLYYISC